jgi:predicted RecB family nuclease
MTVTSRLFEAYLKCPIKCFLWSRGETGTTNTYADWAQAQNISYRSEGIRRLKDGVASNECITGPLDRKDLKSAKWCLAVDSKASAKNLESAIDAVERAPRDTPGKPAQFVPIRFIFTNKLNRHEKLLLAFDALVLSEALGREVDLGNIIHGDASVTLRVKTSALGSKVRKTTAKIATLLAGQVQPDPVLNRHCAECEFRDRCKQKAVGTDDLSLLAGITEDERIRYLRKHKRSVVRFLEAVASANFLSSLANKYKKRFQKSGEKIFTFLDHDGVPWNNNNAEHAIKRFAKYRRDADGRFTETLTAGIPGAGNRLGNVRVQ